MPVSEFLNTRQAAARLEQLGLSVAHRTLAKMRVVSSEGPPFRRFGRQVVYEADSLDRWARERLSAPMRSTSAA